MVKIVIIVVVVVAQVVAQVVVAQVVVVVVVVYRVMGAVSRGEEGLDLGDPCPCVRCRWAITLLALLPLLKDIIIVAAVVSSGLLTLPTPPPAPAPAASPSIRLAFLFSSYCLPALARPNSMRRVVGAM
jgi:hypothetical protein